MSGPLLTNGTFPPTELIITVLKTQNYDWTRNDWALAKQAVREAWREKRVAHPPLCDQRLGAVVFHVDFVRFYIEAPDARDGRPLLWEYAGRAEWRCWGQWCFCEGDFRFAVGEFKRVLGVQIDQ
ncbi:uncharacterized protein BP01DRAFT_383678 [Aspergillus saccharolyticus JOP 1030-1]|uniref:Uncharacterized protein n=1 Tax=Aspergillus saccharolyticus JOP 1030-1 TaxID=1450539 RepID=A0A318Z9U5_9EURO|nr:hypothetical protein BP01DRAFT_383678 [Aspergillus saccharolyticus JOP 1030-1]PYH44185.1 hypothetical protein BP01DRAFT_383678 [Aspergillus saccharolyticus JOP 1030-1]